nr:hypothetical protein [Xenorhabdus sp. TS4]
MASTAVGGNSSSYAKYGVVIGANSQVDTGATNSVAVGYQSYVSGKNSIALGDNSVASEDNVVSIGNDGLGNGYGGPKKLRKLVNLDDGKISDDSKEAINGSQLQKVQDTIKNNEKDIEANKNLLANTNVMAEENARDIISIYDRIDMLEKKCNP